MVRVKFVKFTDFIHTKTFIDEDGREAYLYERVVNISFKKLNHGNY